MLNIANTSENRIFNILLAEDEPSIQLLMERMLNLAGHTVTIANNGQEALSYLKDNLYDVCIFDMQMPVMSGIEAVVTYKNENLKSKIPFIMLTGNTEKKAIEECQNAGVDMYLAKPINSKILVNAIQDVLRTNLPQYDNLITDSIIDITRLTHYQDQYFLDEFIDIFIASAEKLSKDLNNALENNYGVFMNIVHSIKGLSGNIGAQTLREVTIEAESLNLEDYNKYSAEYYTKIVNELLRAQAELVRYSSKNKN